MVRTVLTQGSDLIPGPWLFALAIHTTLHQLQSEFPDIRTFCFLDRPDCLFEELYQALSIEGRWQSRDEDW